MQKKQKRKNKWANLYFICDTANPYLDPITKIPNVLTVVANKKDAIEYIDRRLFIEKYDHYSKWCELRKLAMDIHSWALYKQITPITYFYAKHKVEYNSIASLFRLFYGCTPIGCSFDTLIETSDLFNNREESGEQAGEA